MENTIKKKNIVIGVLAFNVEKYIKLVINDLITLNLPIIVINDNSADNTHDILLEFTNRKNFHLINNPKNYGAGQSTKILLNKSIETGYDFLIKVDGDGQFFIEDIKSIVKIINSSNYDFIKSNRFWEQGIEGKIPANRFFGNLLATVLFQIACGTNKLFDPLNGLFGVNVKITKYLDSKFYPKRYGYPFFISVSAVINNFRTFQINNKIFYDNHPSKLNPFKMLFLLIKLTFQFYFKKIRLKEKIGMFQRTALLDKIFIIFLLVSLVFLCFLFINLSTNAITFMKNITLLNFFILNLVFSIIFFITSFKEEKNLRNSYIDYEE